MPPRPIGEEEEPPPLLLLLLLLLLPSRSLSLDALPGLRLSPSTHTWPLGTSALGALRGEIINVVEEGEEERERE